MTEWRLNCYDGKAYTLPNPVAWRLDYGLGSPCDSFWVKTLWSVGQEETLAAGTRMQVFHDGALCFVGVVDECEVRWSEEGCVAELSGRGLQALLLDNQAEAADFGQATLGEILRRYVTPFGIRLAKPVSLPAAAGFSVGSGSSCWKVLYDFARYHGGATPRFTRTGLMRQTVENAAFRREGGRCSRVLLLPRDTGYQARRYRAQFQLDRSAAERKTAAVTVAIPFAAWPGDLVQLALPGWKGPGRWRVQESQVTLGERGCTTKLTLGKPDAVL